MTTIGEITEMLSTDNTQTLQQHLESLRKSLRAIVTGHVDYEVSEQADLLKAIFKAFPHARSFVDSWTRIEEKKWSDLYGLMLNVMACLVQCCKMLEHSEEMGDLFDHGFHLCRTIVQEQMKYIYRHLSSNTVVLMQAAMALLESVTLYSPQINHAVFKTFNFAMKSLTKLLQLRKKRQSKVPAKSTQEEKPVESDQDKEKLVTPASNYKDADIRTLYIRFILSFLKFGDAATVSAVLGMQNFITAFLKDIFQDPADVVEYVLHIYRTYILDNPGLSRNAKISFFNSRFLENIAQSYHHPEAEARQHVHAFLLYVCANPQSAICFKDHGWYLPNASSKSLQSSNNDQNGDGNAADKKMKLYNKILSSFITSLKPTESAMQQELLLNIFKTAPELVSWYWHNVSGISFEPRSSQKWMENMAWALEVMQLPLPDKLGLSALLHEHQRTIAASTSSHDSTNNTVLKPPPIQTILDNLIPPILTKLMLSKGLQNSDANIKLVISLFLVAVFDKLRLVEDEWNNAKAEALALHFDNETQTHLCAEEWDEKWSQFFYELRRLMPDIQTVISLQQTIPVRSTQDVTSEQADDAEVTRMQIEQASLSLFYHYQKNFTDLIQESRFDYARLLGLFKVEKWNDQLVDLLFMAAPTLKWWKKSDSASLTHMGVLLQERLKLQSLQDEIARTKLKALSQLIYACLTSATIFHGYNDEVIMLVNMIDDTILPWVDQVMTHAMNQTSKMTALQNSILKGSEVIDNYSGADSHASPFVLCILESLIKQNFVAEDQENRAILFGMSYLTNLTHMVGSNALALILIDWALASSQGDDRKEALCKHLQLLRESLIKGSALSPDIQDSSFTGRLLRLVANACSHVISCDIFVSEISSLRAECTEFRDEWTKIAVKKLLNQVHSDHIFQYLIALTEASSKECASLVVENDSIQGLFVQTLSAGQLESPVVELVVHVLNYVKQRPTSYVNALCDWMFSILSAVESDFVHSHSASALFSKSAKLLPSTSILSLVQRLHSTSFICDSQINNLEALVTAIGHERSFQLPLIRLLVDAIDWAQLVQISQSPALLRLYQYIFKQDQPAALECIDGSPLIKKSPGKRAREDTSWFTQWLLTWLLPGGLRNSDVLPAELLQTVFDCLELLVCRDVARVVDVAQFIASHSQELAHQNKFMLLSLMVCHHDEESHLPAKNTREFEKVGIVEFVESHFSDQVVVITRHLLSRPSSDVNRLHSAHFVRLLRWSLHNHQVDFDQVFKEVLAVLPKFPHPVDAGEVFLELCTLRSAQQSQFATLFLLQVVRDLSQKRKRLILNADTNSIDRTHVDILLAKILKLEKVDQLLELLPVMLLNETFGCNGFFDILIAVFKSLLKYRFLDGHAMAFLVRIYQASVEKPLVEPSILVEMITGHSQFNCLFEKHDVHHHLDLNLAKFHILRLLECCMRLSPALASSDMVIKMLCRNVTGLANDSCHRLIMKLLHWTEATTGQAVSMHLLMNCMPAALPKPVSATHTVDVRPFSPQSILEGLSSELVLNAIHHFDVNAGYTCSQSEEKKDLFYDSKPDQYDVMFLMQVCWHYMNICLGGFERDESEEDVHPERLLHSEAHQSRQNRVNVNLLLEKNLISVPIVVLSSADDQLRSSAYALLDHIYTALQVCKVRERNQVMLVLDNMKNVVSNQQDRLPGLITHWFALAVTVMSRPDSFLYPLVNRFLLARATIDIDDVPMFYDLFYSTTDNAKREKTWLLRLLSHGPKTPSDWKLLSRRHVVEQIMATLTGPVNNKIQRDLMLTFLEKCVERDTIRDLALNRGFLAWLTMNPCDDDKLKSLKEKISMKLHADDLVGIRDHQVIWDRWASQF